MTRAAEIERLNRDLLAAVRGYRIAKDTFRVITDIYYRRYPGDPTTAEYQASANFYRKSAIADAEWYRNEILACSAALTVLGGAP